MLQEFLNEAVDENAARNKEIIARMKSNSRSSGRYFLLSLVLELPQDELE